jgi:hypothetical protein
MAQYIQHPALIGAQMAGDLTKQRMNLVGQGVTQAVDALNRQAAADAAATTKMMEYQSLMRAQRNPTTGAYESGAALPSKDWMNAFNQMIFERQASRGGYDPKFEPGKPGWYTGAPIVTPAAEVPPVAGTYPKEYDPTILNVPSIRPKQAAYPVATDRSLARDILNFDIFGMRNP